MRWAVILASPDISGGSYVIYEHCIRAARRGISVDILTKEKVDPSKLFWHPEARELNWKTLEEASKCDYSVAIATFPHTVYDLHKIEAGNYIYFVQLIESRFFQDDPALRKYMDSTYMLPLNVITEATWIKNFLEEEYGLNVRLVKNGVRKDIYKRDGFSHAPKDPNKLRVLVEGPTGIWFKNVEKTVEIVRKSLADEVWLLTGSELKFFSGADRIFSKVPIFETPAVYRSCDVLVKLSLVEGMFGPPLEMFHCGGTAITYNVSGYDEYIRHGENALVADLNNESQVIEYINTLKTQPATLERLKAGALKTAEGWPDWDSASLEFEDAVRHFTGTNNISRDLLRKKSEFYREFFELTHRPDNRGLVKKWIRDPFAAFLFSRCPKIHSFLKHCRDFILSRSFFPFRSK